MEEEALFPVIEIEDDGDEGDEDEYDTEYRRSMKWDFGKGDFMRDGAHRVVECDGYEAFATWCYKVAQTEREACLAYPEEVGAELEDALGDDDAEAVESMLERTVTEALEVNPRTEYVRDFEFSWDGDSVHVSFTVKGVGWDEEVRVAF